VMANRFGIGRRKNLQKLLSRSGIKDKCDIPTTHANTLA